jgi:hypothetical protein
MSESPLIARRRRWTAPPRTAMALALVLGIICLQLAIAPLLLASVPLFTADGALIFLLALLWIIAARVALIRRIDTATAAATSGQPPAPQPVGTAA